MKHSIKSLLLALCSLAGTTAASGNNTQIILHEDFNQPASLARWSKPPGMEHRNKDGVDNSGCIAFVSKERQSGLMTLKLDPAVVAGRSLAVEAMMKGQNISKPDKAYLGPKLMIHLKNPYGESWLDQTKKYGSYDWEKLSVFVRVPHDAELVELCLGLQGSTGELLIDELKVTLLPTVALRRTTDAQQEKKLQTSPRLRGVMSGRRMEENDIKELAQNWHANLIRYQITNYSKVDTVGREKYIAWLKSELDKMDKVVELCRKYNIKILIDLHSGPSMTQGELLSNILSWTHESQDTLTEVWQLMAARYKDEPVIWGYDILNEPREDNYVYTPDGPLDWNRLAERVVAAIRRIDPDKPVIVEPAQWGSPAGLQVFQPLAFDNIIYSVHFYAPSIFTHQGIHGRQDGISYPGMIAGKNWDKEELRKRLKPALDFQRKYNVPIYIGEFSVVRWADGAAQWLDEVIDIFEEYGWDWTYHAFREFHGWSVEYSSDRNVKGETGDSDRKKILLKYMQRNLQTAGEKKK